MRRDIVNAYCILICCGINGIMKKACKGAVENNELTIGILPTRNKEDANEYDYVPYKREHFF
ncbi:MAG: hypothetical protein GW779_02170 [Candidatus Altiarchaeum hamiconexum]|uniref:Uncharacterized protein n=1 Tax=Candidatus Altarchaeum hamiconexum TaxID=1803513 RepID=A0A8J7Z3A3_9ARCH|nr:hypothetical protein [Candidatus Altarchaeum hamiconexum]NCN68416.1 hypothetical protein [Candidatus Altarchaeum hamiconexum]NCS91215.1 hypothetical protein [Candidatus Altarchaeum hamiconexum]NCT01111.1 hypothetical protein [Candidatus Altarchaeum hamiconexum]